MRTLAAIPAYNEEVAIGSIVLQCQQYADEVLVVDDGSDDRTAGVAKLARAFVIRHDVNKGKGSAIQSALRHARMNGFGAMVLLDGDGQHDPADIPSLLSPVLSGEADLVVGVRRRATSKMPLYRRAGQRVLDYLTAVGSKSDVTDSQSGFRALSRTAIESLVLEERDFGVESEMLVEAQEKGLRLAEVPIQARYDVEGSTKGPVSHGLSVVDRLLKIIAVRHPLLFFGIFGVGVIIAGMILGLLALRIYPSNPEQAIGYSFLVVLCMLFGGVALLMGIVLNVLPDAVARAIRNRGS